MSIEGVRPGDIGFCLHTDNKISRTIAWFMGSRYSHAFLVAGELEGKTIILETSDFEITINTLDRYIEDPKTRIVIYSPAGMEDAERHDVVREGMKYLGEVYGYLQLLSFAVKRLLKRIGIWVPNFCRQGIVCNQVVLYSYQVSGSYPELASVDPESIDPQEMMEIMIKSSRFDQVIEKPEP